MPSNNASNKAEHPPPKKFKTMKKHSEDDAIDELLKEHARGDSGNDAFMTELEGRLDDSEQRTGAGGHRKTYWWIPLSAVAAICLFWSARIWWEPANPEPSQEVAKHGVRPANRSSPTNLSVGFAEKVRRAPSPRVSRGDIITASGGSHPDFASLGSEDGLVSSFSPTISFGDSLSDSGSLSAMQNLASSYTPAGREMSPEERVALLTHIENDFGVAREFRPPGTPAHSGDRHMKLVENKFLDPALEASKFSTFAVDVDTASYSYLRAAINAGQRVPADAVRLEEIVNYFDYGYAQPDGEHPFAVHIDSASCPWQENHRLVRIGLQGKDIVRTDRPAANLVFLLDVSGSMQPIRKTPAAQRLDEDHVGGTR